MREVRPETELVAERYARRTTGGYAGRYSMLDPAVWQGVQERQRALIGLLARHAGKPLDQLTLLEIGCGGGGNLLELLRLGFSAGNLLANELLPERAGQARQNLPAACTVLEGDATALRIEDESLDIVYQATVFTSLLDADFQRKLAHRMWQWVRPGGGVLWYDFVYDNPRNPDVAGMPLAKVRLLFPEGEFHIRRVTLAPPLSRMVCRLHPSLYTACNAVPFLRTHVLCWIGKRERNQ